MKYGIQGFSEKWNTEYRRARNTVRGYAALRVLDADCVLVTLLLAVAERVLLMRYYYATLRYTATVLAAAPSSRLRLPKL